MSATRCALTLGAVLVLSACAAQTAYNWGRYDPALYAYYKDPTKLSDLESSLQAVIDDANTHRSRVPPGIYAEYGYLELQQGQTQKAVQLFKEEETRWPESRQFMEHMIQVATRPNATSTTAAPAAAQ